MEVHKLKCDRLIPPKQPTYKAVGDYHVSKWLTRQFPKETEGDDVLTGNVAVSLSIAKRGLHNAEVRLATKRHYEATQRKLLDEKWDELERKEQELRENFIQYNEFVKENEDKRNRARDQKEASWNQHRERTIKVNELREECYELKKIQKLMENKLDEYSIYEDFLSKVVKGYPDYFSDILDVLKRYGTLMHAKKYLSEKMVSDANTLQADRKVLRTVIDTYYDKLEMMHNKVAVLNQRHEAARISCLKWEGVLADVREKISHIAMEISEVENTCTVLYEQVCQRMQVKPVYKGNMEMQMFCIRKALRDLDMVKRRIRAMRERDVLASERSLMSGSSK